MEMSDIDLTPWDSADHLKTEAAQLEYMRAAFHEAGDDPAFMVHALGVVARARNVSRLARDTGLSRAGIYKALGEDGNPTFATVVGILRSLGLKLDLTPITAG